MKNALLSMTADQILNEYLILVTSPGQPQPDETTTISPELIETLIKRYDEWNGHIPKEMCHYDPESNSIKPGIKHRKPHGDQD